MIDDTTWEDILSFIEIGQVIPVLGQGVTTIESDNQLLMPSLAEKLADKLGITLADETSKPSLNQVICQYLIEGGKQQLVHTRLNQVVRDFCPEPGATLCNLAKITPLKFFLSTTFDPLLIRALEQVRQGETVDSFDYSPNAASKDIPTRIAALKRPTVYQILGKASPAGGYVAWEDDMMEFIFGLHKDLSMSVMPNMSKDLSNPDMHFLILGLNFSDWLVRFFIRAARQSSFSKAIGIDYIAENSDEAVTNGLVMFFSSAGRNVNVLQCDPREFVAELSKRWQAQNGITNVSLNETENLVPSRSSSSETIFVSYAREDERAAYKLKNGLEERGLEVWMDQCELRNGTNFSQELRKIVEQDCKFFISLISRTTESESESYFHLERNWAAKRAERFNDRDRGAFYHPVIIDDLELGSISKDPVIFRESQRVRLLDGIMSEAFAERMIALVGAAKESRS